MQLLRSLGRLFPARKVAPRSIVVRGMSSADRDTVVSMLGQLSEFEQRFETDRTGDPGAASVGFAEVEAEIASAGGFVLVACDDAGRLIGFACVVIRRDSTYIADRFRRYAYICDLFVADDWRNAGVGRALLDEVIGRSRTLGLARIGIGALANNDATRAAYTRWGFRAYAVEHVMDLE